MFSFNKNLSCNCFLSHTPALYPLFLFSFTFKCLKQFKQLGVSKRFSINKINSNNNNSCSKFLKSSMNHSRQAIYSVFVFFFVFSIFLFSVLTCECNGNRCFPYNLCDAFTLSHRKLSFKRIWVFWYSC